MDKDDLVRDFAPYCADRLKSGRWLYLNRDYKPLGYRGRVWQDYDAYHGFALKEPLTLEMANEVCGPKSDWSGQLGPHIFLDNEWQPRALHFYFDGSTPWFSARDMKRYLARLERFNSLIVDSK